MPDRGWRPLVVALVFADAAAVWVALAVAGSACRGALSSVGDCPDVFASVSLLPLALPILLGAFWIRGAYLRRNLLGGPDEYAAVVAVVLMVAAGTAIAAYVTGTSSAIPRPWFLMFWPTIALVAVVQRFVLRRIAYSYRRRGGFRRRVFVVGASNQGLAIAGQLHHTSAGIDVVGVVDDYLPLGTRLPLPKGAPLRVVGHPQEVARLAAEYLVDLIVVVPAALGWESQQAMIDLLDAERPGFEVRFAPTAFDVTSVGFEPAPLQYVPLLRLRSRRLVTFDAFLRTAVDYPIALAGFLLVGPFLLALAAVARARGVTGIIEHRQIIGERGSAVTVPLLSSKVSGALLLRGCPALLSILRGELALVGPRPIPVDEAPGLSRWKRLLVSVKPGLTGPWRLLGPELPMEERIFADVWWVRNWTIWRHLFVLFQTMVALLPRRVHPGRLARWRSVDPSPAPMHPEALG